jgi:hypothetical protein
MVLLFRASSLVLLGLAFLCASACIGDLPERQLQVDGHGADEQPPRRISTFDGALSISVPVSMTVHRFDSAIHASTANGEFRLAVNSQEQQPLLVVAGRGKETLLARGWLIEGEQHYEKAILARFRKGGNASRPRHRRETWWIQGHGANLVCDGVASRDGFDRLGDGLRSLCKAVAVQEVPAQTEVAPVP